MAAQDGSLDMSIGFWCGAVPSSLTIPETLVPEGGAAFTTRCETWTATASRINPEKIAINLCEFGFFMISFSRCNHLFWSSLLFSVAGAGAGAGAAAGAGGLGLIGFSPSCFAICFSLMLVLVRGCSVLK